MNRPTRMLFATVMLGVGLGAMGVAYAAEDAKMNKCWGQITKQFAATMATASASTLRDPPGFEPGEGGREGVGNVSKKSTPR